MAEAAAHEFDVPAPSVAHLAGRIWRSAAAGRFLRGPGLLWAGNEVTVVEAGEILRIDRLVELEEAGERVWWVLDYKLQHAPEQVPEYREQLRRYARAVRALQPGARVRCAFLTGDGEAVEIDA
jgi:ATP-dependent helicase/nuclease subunit A